MAPMPGQGMATDVEKQPDREIIRNGDMSVRVDDVRTGIDDVGAIAAAAGGRIASQTLDAMGEDLYGYVTLRVPADRLDGVIDEIGTLGTVTSLSVYAEDVTAQGVDLDARIAALQTSITRLQELLAEATSTKDLIDIEGELTARQAELDSLVAQRAALSDAVALSTLSVSITPSSEAAEWTPPGFLSGLESGWNAFRTTMAGLVTAAGFALPFLVAGALLVVPIVILVVVLSRRRRKG